MQIAKEAALQSAREAFALNQADKIIVLKKSEKKSNFFYKVLDRKRVCDVYSFSPATAEHLQKTQEKRCLKLNSEGKKTRIRFFSGVVEAHAG